MQFKPVQEPDGPEIARLFNRVFSASENESEGQVLANLVTELNQIICTDDLYGFMAIEKAQIQGAIYLSRVHIGSSSNHFLLSPVAINTAKQGQGLGQQLIRFGLAELKALSANWVLTYGDPSFYHKVGFKPVSDQSLIPPYPLSQPNGWLGQSLKKEPIQNLNGNCHCVPAFDRPELW